MAQLPVGSIVQTHTADRDERQASDVNPAATTTRESTRREISEVTYC